MNNLDRYIHNRKRSKYSPQNRIDQRPVYHVEKKQYVFICYHVTFWVLGYTFYVLRFLLSKVECQMSKVCLYTFYVISFKFCDMRYAMYAFNVLTSLGQYVLRILSQSLKIS